MLPIILIYVNILNSMGKINCLTLLKYFSIPRLLQIFCFIYNHLVRVNHFKLYFSWLTHKVSILTKNKHANKQSLATMNVKRLQIFPCRHKIKSSEGQKTDVEDKNTKKKNVG